MDFDVPPPAIRAKYCFSLHFPVSMTYFTPGIVIDVSAMLVANIHFRVFGGGDMKTFAFFPGAWAANMGQTNTYDMVNHSQFKQTNLRTSGESWGRRFANMSIDFSRLSMSS